MRCHDTYSVSQAANLNNAQIFTIGARVIRSRIGQGYCEAFLSSTLDPEGRLTDNVGAINKIDEKILSGFA